MLFLIFILIILGAISFIFSKRVKSSEDFMVGGGNIPFAVLAFTMAATQFGGSSLVGGVQQGAQLGFWPGMYPIFGMILAMLCATVVGPKYRTVKDVITPADYIEARYGKSRFLRGYHALTFMISLIAMTTSQIVSFAQLATTFGVDYKIAVLICSVSVVIFTVLSGMWGVAVTDAIQFGFILILLPIVSIFSFKALGAESIKLGDLLAQPIFSSSAAFSAFMYSTMPTMFGTMFNYDTFTRYQSSKDIKSTQKATLLAALLLAATAIPIGLLGASAFYLFPGTESSSVVSTLISSVLPKPIAYMFVIVVMMALMTSADSFLTSFSTIVSRDIYTQLLERGKNGKDKSLLISRIALCVAAILVGIAAINFTSIIKITFYFSPLTTGVMFAPMVIGLFWKKASRKGAFAAVICGAGLALCHIFGLFIFVDRVLGVMIVGSAALVVFSLIFPDDKTEHAL